MRVSDSLRWWHSARPFRSSRTGRLSLAADLQVRLYHRHFVEAGFSNGTSQA
jgi:hypothetical protein